MRLVPLTGRCASRDSAYARRPIDVTLDARTPDAADREPIVEVLEPVTLVGEDQHAPAGDVIAALRSRSARDDEPRGNNLHLISPTTNPG